MFPSDQNHESLEFKYDMIVLLGPKIGRIAFVRKPARRFLNDCHIKNCQEINDVVFFLSSHSLFSPKIIQNLPKNLLKLKQTISTSDLSCSSFNWISLIFPQAFKFAPQLPLHPSNLPPTSQFLFPNIQLLSLLVHLVSFHPSRNSEIPRKSLTSLPEGLSLKLISPLAVAQQLVRLNSQG